MSKAEKKAQKTPSAKAIGVRIGGEAGQGVILSGVMLAEIAALDGKEVAQSARYGAAVRGGEATADVVIATEPIDYPHVERPDFLVVLSQPTYDRYAPLQAESTLVMYDPFFVKAKELSGVRQLALPATEAAIHELGNPTGANIIVLSALAAVSRVVTEGNLRAVVESSGSKRFRESNLRALDIGVRLAAAALEAS